MERVRRKPSLPDAAFLRQCVRLDRKTSVLVWRKRPRSHFRRRTEDYAHWRARYAGKAAGSRRPDGRLVVSVRFEGKLRTLAADRVAWAIHFGAFPRGRIAFADGDADNLAPENLLDLPRRARSIGKPGGKAAERARDRDLLGLLAEKPSATVAALAEATSLARCNVSRRLRRLQGQGLTQSVCVPGRSHWLVTPAGHEAACEAEEADLLAPADLNGHAAPWARPLYASAAKDVLRRLHKGDPPDPAADWRRGKGIVGLRRFELRRHAPG